MKGGFILTSISVSNLNFAYDKQSIIQNLSVNFAPGKIHLLIGENGAGKSTLLKIMAGLLPKFGGKLTGKISIDAKTSMMFQDPELQFALPTAYDELIFTMENLKVSRETYKDKINHVAKFTGISHLLKQPLAQLSGGEKQKVALAILLVMDSDLLLLDEPFANCDLASRRNILIKLKKLVKAGKTVIIVDHDLPDYETLADEIWLFKDKQLHQLTNEERTKLFKQLKQYSKVKFSLPQNQKSIFNFSNTVIKQQLPLIEVSTQKIYQGKITLLTGENGAGKTTLFKTLTKIHPYYGNLTYKSKEIKGWHLKPYLSSVAQVFQEANNQFLEITVQEELTLSQKKQVNPYFTKEKLAKSLEKLGLNKLLDHSVYTLSGGQKKKLQILLMLLNNHDVLLLDEPLAGLDTASRQIIINLLSDIQKQTNQTFIIISHQICELAPICNYHLVLAKKGLTYVQNGGEDLES